VLTENGPVARAAGMRHAVAECRTARLFDRETRASFRRHARRVHFRKAHGRSSLTASLCYRLLTLVLSPPSAAGSSALRVRRHLHDTQRRRPSNRFCSVRRQAADVSGAGSARTCGTRATTSLRLETHQRQLHPLDTGGVSSARMGTSIGRSAGHSPLARSAQRACDRGVARQRLESSSSAAEQRPRRKPDRRSLPDADAVIQLERAMARLMSVRAVRDTL